MPSRPKPPHTPRRAPRRPSPSRTGKGRVSPPSRSGKKGSGRRVPVPRSGHGATSSFPWLPVGIGTGGLLLIVALVLGGHALLAPKPTPIPQPTATPPATSTATATPTPDDAPTATVLPSATPEAVPAVLPDIPALQRLMHRLINEDRRANGLAEVSWDETAALAGLQHAKEMAKYGYVSHRNLDGYGPDYRYSMAGGLYYVMENVHATWSAPGGGPKSSAEWEQWTREAQTSLMASEGHRANILKPEHTHVGIGIAYEPTTGYFAVTQEFVNQYITVQPLLRSVALGQSLTLSGWLGAGASNPLLNIAYEPLPAPLSLAALKPETYSSPAENYDIPAVEITDAGQLTASFTLNYQDQPGLYHIRLWVETQFGQVQAMDTVIQVQ